MEITITGTPEEIKELNKNNQKDDLLIDGKKIGEAIRPKEESELRLKPLKAAHIQAGEVEEYKVATTKERFEKLAKYVDEELKGIVESLEEENETYTDIIDTITYDYPNEEPTEKALNNGLYSVMHTKLMKQATKK